MPCTALSSSPCNDRFPGTSSKLRLSWETQQTFLAVTLDAHGHITHGDEKRLQLSPAAAAGFLLADDLFILLEVPVAFRPRNFSSNSKVPADKCFHCRLKTSGDYHNKRFHSVQQAAKPLERGPPHERRVPPAGDVAEVIREKGSTRVQSRRRRPLYPVPSNLSPPSAPATDTTPRPKRKKAPAPATP
ncbi:unnamed protein product [Pleuronectes platessa]|uniref:Uncharacterized protein n=1 Tax=Pleuronectes platessa TaxID=8262 RepID=A0A9N7Z6I5_PLEPL|nr:unnamed protein product [Pleuronectes platessa]